MPDSMPLWAVLTIWAVCGVAAFGLRARERHRT